MIKNKAASRIRLQLGDMKPRKRLQKRAFEALASAKIYVSDSRGYAVNYPWHACKWHKIKVS